MTTEPPQECPAHGGRMALYGPEFAKDPRRTYARLRDYGPLAESWRQEPGTPAYGAPYGSPDDEKGTPASVEVIQEAIGAATR